MKLLIEKPHGLQNPVVKCGQGNGRPIRTLKEIADYLRINQFKLVTCIRLHKDFPKPVIERHYSGARHAHYDARAVVAWYRNHMAEKKQP